MEVKSLSATAIKAWLDCPARFVAENQQRAPRAGGWAADLGSCYHTTLEFFVKGCFLDPELLKDSPGIVHQEPSIELLMYLWDESYKQYFPHDNQWYAEGITILREWYSRSVPMLMDPAREVLSTEVKKQFKLTWHGVDDRFIPFNYIFDRVDRINRPDGQFDIEVTDYKSWRMPRNLEGLDRDVQMRIYGVAAQMEYPEAGAVWVTLDQLRFNNVGTRFTREQNIATWRMLQDEGWKILHTDEDKAEERINSNCRWCIRKVNCKTLARNTAVGGSLALSDTNDIAVKFAKVSAQIKALSAVEEELESALIEAAAEQDMTEFDTPDARVKIVASRRRKADPQRVASIIGEDLFAQMGSFTVGAIDTLLKGNDITPEQKAALRSMAITSAVGNPRPVVELRGSLEDEE